MEIQFALLEDRADAPASLQSTREPMEKPQQLQNSPQTKEMILVNHKKYQSVLPVINVDFYRRAVDSNSTPGAQKRHHSAEREWLWGPKKEPERE